MDAGCERLRQRATGNRNRPIQSSRSRPSNLRLLAISYYGTRQEAAQIKRGPGGIAAKALRCTRRSVPVLRNYCAEAPAGQGKPPPAVATLTSKHLPTIVPQLAPYTARGSDEDCQWWQANSVAAGTLQSVRYHDDHQHMNAHTDVSVMNPIH
jgi:hypothetical protein